MGVCLRLLKMVSELSDKRIKALMKSFELDSTWKSWFQSQGPTSAEQTVTLQVQNN